MDFLISHIPPFPEQITVATDWTGIAALSLATFGGAAVGAWISGVQSGRHALRIMNKQRKLDGLERMLFLIDKLENEYLEHVATVAISLKGGGFSVAKEKARNKLGEERGPFELGLLPLASVYFPDKWDEIYHLVNNISLLMKDVTWILYERTDREMREKGASLSEAHWLHHQQCFALRKKIVALMRQ